MKAIDVTDVNFEKVVLQSDKTILVDFGAEWCPPCVAMKPVLDQLAGELSNNAIIAKLDVDSNPEFTARYKVRNLPTFLLFKDGEVIDRIVGAVPKSVLHQKIAALL